MIYSTFSKTFNKERASIFNDEIPFFHEWVALRQRDYTCHLSTSLPSFLPSFLPTYIHPVYDLPRMATRSFFPLVIRARTQLFVLSFPPLLLELGKLAPSHRDDEGNVALCFFSFFPPLLLLNFFPFQVVSVLCKQRKIIRTRRVADPMKAIRSIYPRSWAKNLTGGMEYETE